MSLLALWQPAHLLAKRAAPSGGAACLWEHPWKQTAEIIETRTIPQSRAVHLRGTDGKRFLSFIRSAVLNPL